MNKDKMNEIKELEDKAKEIRRIVFRMIVHAGGGHIAPALSIVDLLTVLYFSVLRVCPHNPKADDRDRCILSKGHACTALYAVLAERGFISKSALNTLCKEDSSLGGHPDMHSIPGVDASTGSLGHGLPFGVGVALSGKLDKKDFKVYTILGDGECQEGSVWEAAMFASHHKLDNLVAIVDYNKLQAIDKIDNIVTLKPLKDKWESFGWEAREINGHDLKQIVESLQAIPFSKDKPSVIIAHTIKGKGISFMENVPIWHYRLPNPKEMKIAREQLEIDKPI
jgi:transketolase